MFTGIIEETGIVKDFRRIKGSARLSIKPEKSFNLVKCGDSISVNGACLTVVDLTNKLLTFDVMEETLRKTNIKRLDRGSVVNLERALKSDGRVEGHFVLGHVDGERQIKIIRKYATPYLDILLSGDDRRYVVKKGSVAIDGISLTVSDVFADALRVNIIPYTFKNTNLKHKSSGDFVNIEFDILGKYIIGSTDHKVSSRITDDFLKNKGFI